MSEPEPPIGPTIEPVPGFEPARDDSPVTDIEPVPDDAISAVTVGLLVWAAAAVVCVLLHDQLADSGRGWWVWTCLAGVAIGGFMLVLFRERRSRIIRHRAEADEPTSVG